MGLALGLAVAALALPATPLAEVTIGTERSAGVAATRPGALQGQVTTRCWQEGREILAIEDFAQAEVGLELRERSVSLAQAGAAGRTAVIVPLADALCLLTIRP